MSATATPNADLLAPKRCEISMSAEVQELVTAVCTVMAQVGVIAKTKGQNLPYEYLSEDAITGTLRPLLAAAGLMILPRGCETVEREDYTAGKGGEMTRAVARHTFRILHKSGQWIDGQVWGEASDSGDKCFNKVMTDAYKYFLRETFAINGGHDPDAHGPDEVSRGARNRGTTSPNRNAAAGTGGATNRSNGQGGAPSNGRPANQPAGQASGPSGAQQGSDERAAKCAGMIDNAATHEAVDALIDKAKQVAWTDAQIAKIKGAAAARHTALWVAAIKVATDENAISAVLSAATSRLGRYPELVKAVEVNARNRAGQLAAESEAAYNASTPEAGSGDDQFSDMPVAAMEF